MCVCLHEDRGRLKSLDYFGNNVNRIKGHRKRPDSKNKSKGEGIRGGVGGDIRGK